MFKAHGAALPPSNKPEAPSPAMTRWEYRMSNQPLPKLPAGKVLKSVPDTMSRELALGVINATRDMMDAVMRSNGKTVTIGLSSLVMLLSGFEREMGDHAMWLAIANNLDKKVESLLKILHMLSQLPPEQVHTQLQNVIRELKD